MKTVLLASLAMCLFWVAEQVGAEPLLSCVLAGVVTTNRSGEVCRPCTPHPVAGTLICWTYAPAGCVALAGCRAGCGSGSGCGPDHDCGCACSFRLAHHGWNRLVKGEAWGEKQHALYCKPGPSAQ